MCISTIRTAERTPTRVPAIVTELSKTCEAASRSVRKHLVVQHNYHDHATDPAPATAQHVLDDTAINHNAFPLKLYEMLSLVERDGFSHVVSWQPHGRCFVVHKPDEFKTILPRYFKLSKVASFQRQLNLYGFMRLTRGMDKGGYYHELFLRGRIWLAQKIQRVKVKGTGVRAKSNPAQEPDFWNMPWATPNPNAGDITPPTSDSSSPTIITSLPPQQQHKQSDDCTTSVVSQDEEEPQRLPQHEPISVKSKTVEPLPAPSSLSPLVRKQEPRDNTLVTSWGKPFYYLSRPPSPNHAIPKAIEDDLDKILYSMDFDEAVQDLLENSQGQSFAQLLERAIR